jgi:hypothetical protein
MISRSLSQLHGWARRLIGLALLAAASVGSPRAATLEGVAAERFARSSGEVR